MKKLYSIKIGNRKLYTDDKVFAQFMNKKKSKPGFIKKAMLFIKKLVEKILP